MDTPSFKKVQNSLDKLIKLSHHIDKRNQQKDLLRIIAELTEEIREGVQSMKKENEQLKNAVDSLESEPEQNPQSRRHNNNKDWFTY